MITGDIPVSISVI